MVVYFSGTGNSRFCAELIACALKDRVLNSADYIKNGIAAELVSESPWVFVAPTYAWQMPRVFADFIRSGSFSGSREAYFVLTCGSGIGAAGKMAEKLCREVGLEYRGIHRAVMPENYIAMFSAPGKEEAERIIASAKPGLEKAAERIRRGEPLPRGGNGFFGGIKSGPVSSAFYRFFISAKAFRTDEKCVGCGKCADDCPLGNIEIKNGRPVWGENCTHCMACICGCPAEAVEYGKTSRGKNRYICPEYSAK